MPTVQEEADANNGYEKEREGRFTDWKKPRSDAKTFCSASVIPQKQNKL